MQKCRACQLASQNVDADDDSDADDVDGHDDKVCEVDGGGDAMAQHDGNNDKAEDYGSSGDYHYNDGAMANMAGQNNRGKSSHHSTRSRS